MDETAFDTVSDLLTHAPPSDALTPNGGTDTATQCRLSPRAHPRPIIATTVHAASRMGRKALPDNRTTHGPQSRPDCGSIPRTWLSISASRPPYCRLPSHNHGPSTNDKDLRAATSKHQHDENSPPLRNRRADLIKMGPVMPLRWSPPPWRRTA